MRVLWDRLWVGEDEDIVFSAFDADREWVLLALEEVDILFEGDDFKVGVVILEEFEDEERVVVGEVVDDDHFEVGVLLFEEEDEFLAEPVGVVAGGEDDAYGRERWWGGGRGGVVAAHAHVVEPVVDSEIGQSEQHDGGQCNGVCIS